MNTKRNPAIIAAATSILFLGAGSASAGEITGNERYVPGGDTGRSACSYSGRQDNYEEDIGFFRSMIVQNWGQIPKSLREFLTSIGQHPGQACNPSGSGGD